MEPGLSFSTGLGLVRHQAEEDTGQWQWLSLFVSVVTLLIITQQNLYLWLICFIRANEHYIPQSFVMLKGTGCCCCVVFGVLTELVSVPVTAQCLCEHRWHGYCSPKMHFIIYSTVNESKDGRASHSVLLIAEHITQHNVSPVYLSDAFSSYF